MASPGPPSNKRASDELGETTTPASASQQRKRPRNSRGPSVNSARGTPLPPSQQSQTGSLKSSPPSANALAIVPEEQELQPGAAAEASDARPSSILGLAGVISRLPTKLCRAVLANLPSADVRALLTAHTTAHPLSLASSRVTESYDRLFTPRADQLVAFDTLVASIITDLSCFEGQNLTVDGELDSLQSTLNSPNGVFANIRVLHASAVSPASFGTKMNALQALVAITRYLIENKFLLDPQPRELFDQGPIGKAFLDLCHSLTKPERRLILRSVEKELSPQAKAFKKNQVFSGVVEAYQFLKMSEVDAAVVQVLPLGVGMEDSQVTHNGDGAEEDPEGVSLLSEAMD